MSSTNRGTLRSPNDIYMTPLWTVHRIMEALPDLPAGQWLDPCAGSGNIIYAAKMLRPEIDWQAVELRPECLEVLLGAGTRPTLGNFLSPNVVLRADVVLMNPPYRLAQEFIEKSIKTADHVVALLRLNYLGSKGRAEFMRAHCPDVYVLPNRPSFNAESTTDSIEYAWFHWNSAWGSRKVGRIEVLPLTPLEERRLGKS